MSQTCEKCKFWKYGECSNPKVREALFTYDYQIVFSKSFGCIFWETAIPDQWGGNTIEPEPYKPNHAKTES